MKEVKIMEFNPGTDIMDAIVSAKKNATPDTDVQFRFNGIDVAVATHTNVGSLYRDYTVSHMLGWQTIGPDCAYIWDSETFRKLSEYKSPNH